MSAAINLALFTITCYENAVHQHFYEKKIYFWSAFDLNRNFIHFESMSTHEIQSSSSSSRLEICLESEGVVSRIKGQSDRPTTETNDRRRAGRRSTLIRRVVVSTRKQVSERRVKPRVGVSQTDRFAAARPARYDLNAHAQPSVPPAPAKPLRLRLLPPSPTMHDDTFLRIPKRCQVSCRGRDDTTRKSARISRESGSFGAFVQALVHTT